MIVYVSSVTEFPKNLLGHILNYYTPMGVNKFYFTVYGGSKAPAWEELKIAAKNHPIEFHENLKPWNPYNDAEYKNIIRKTLSPSDFLIPADFDEFHFHPKYDTFIKLGESMTSENADFVKTTLIDRITSDGNIPTEILPNVPLTEQFPVIKNISKDIMGCYTVKMIMVKPHVEIWSGHHILSAHKDLRPFSTEAQTNHFKWFGNLREKETKKIEMYKTLGVEWYHEQERLFEYLNHNSGKLQ